MKPVGFLLCACAFTLAVATAGETTTLDELLSSHSARPKLGQPFKPLQLPWVGDLIDEDGKITKLRLDHGGIPVPKKDPMLVRMRGKSYLANEGPGYLEHLPTPEDLRKTKSLAELESLLGDSGPVIDGWEEDGRTCWNPDWVRFTREAENRLLILRVSASVSQATGESNDAPARVDRISIAKGLLRPANPDSKDELREYPTGDALFVAEQEEKRLEREHNPSLFAI